jgi:hypothetical protein
LIEEQANERLTECPCVFVQKHYVVKGDLIERIQPITVHRHNDDAHKLNVARARQQRNIANAMTA